MAETITPNMGLTNPDPLVTPGPTYSTEISSDLDIIDAHTHAPGNGAPIPSAAFNINADISFNGFSPTDVGVTAYQSAVAAPSNINAVSVQAGELVYRDADGALVVITNNGSVAGATGTISGLVAPASATYSSITETLVISSDTNEAAKLAISDIIQYKYADTSGANLTHKWAPASPVSYVIQYPDDAPLTNDSVAKTSTTGVQTFNAFGIVPVGGIIAIASNLSGSFAVPTTGTSSRGWQLCDGATVEAGGTLSGNVPQLTDSRFLMGSTVAGTIAGTNTAAITGSQTLNHTHGIAHTHMWSADTSNSGGQFETRLSSDRNSTTMAATTAIFQNVTIASGSGQNAYQFITRNNNYFTTGVLDTTNGSSGTGAITDNAGPVVSFSNATLNSGDIRPAYLSTVYLIRIR